MTRWMRLGPLAVAVVASALLAAGPASAQDAPPPNTPECTKKVNAEQSVKDAEAGTDEAAKTTARDEAITRLCTGTAATGSGSGGQSPAEEPTDTKKPASPDPAAGPQGDAGQQSQGAPSSNRTGGGRPAATAKQQRTGDQNCPDFANQGDAQEYFESKGGSASNNVDRLDANHNGVACEDYFDDGDNQAAEVTSTGDDGSEATTSGDQVTEVPEGSAQTGGF